jgi:membrane protein involved in colicin uptake
LPLQHAGGNNAGLKFCDDVTTHEFACTFCCLQVSALMSDRQRLSAQCSTLQRENEQLTELVGYLSLEQQQLLEQQQQQNQQDQQNQLDQQQQGKQQQQLVSVSDEPELEASWYSEQGSGMAEEASGLADLAAEHADAAAPMHTSSVSSMDAVFASEDDISVEAFH